MIKINIFMAIYTYNKDIHRYNLTEKIFKHYKNIEKKFKDLAKFTFTILGSEKKLSQNLCLKFFKPEEYEEFDQDLKNFDNDFYTMLRAKIKHGMNISKKKNADIMLWAGSNDYICYDYFEQIIDYYDPTKPQLYGISNYKNGKNAVFFTHYDGNRDINNLHCLTANDKTTCYWWDGISDYCNRKKYNYCAATIGINNKCDKLYPDIIDNWTEDEGFVEEYITKKNKIDIFVSQNCFYMNIKTMSETEIHSFSILRDLNNKNLLQFNDFSEDFKLKFIKEFNDFSLPRSNSSKSKDVSVQNSLETQIYFLTKRVALLEKRLSLLNIDV
jgi:hypothetical protein